jgi:citrate lyase subunit beta-like protein
MRARRAVLYTPGDDLNKISKVITLGVDCACLDMEDGVAVSHKEAARQTIAEALCTLDFGRTERLVRINPVGSGLEQDDLIAVLPARPDGVVIPKVRDGSQIKWVSEQISTFEEQYNLPNGGIILIAIIETAIGIVNLGEIASSDSRLEALIFGAEDLAADIGAHRSQSGWEVFHSRSEVVTHAAAYGLQAIDMVYIDFQDSAGLQVQATQGAHLGFDGKQIIHPNQVNPVQVAYTPKDKEIAEAQSIVDAFAAHQAAGKGAFAMDGKMVDAPLVKSAQAVLERARAAGII